MAWETAYSVNEVRHGRVLTNGDGNYYMVSAYSTYDVRIYYATALAGPWSYVTVTNCMEPLVCIDDLYIHLIGSATGIGLYYTRFNLSSLSVDISAQTVLSGDYRYMDMVEIGTGSSYELWYLYEDFSGQYSRAKLGRRNTNGTYTNGISLATGVSNKTHEYPLMLGRGVDPLLHIYFKWSNITDLNLRHISYHRTNATVGSVQLLANNVYYVHNYVGTNTAHHPLVRYTDSSGNVHNVLTYGTTGVYTGVSLSTGSVALVDIISAVNPSTSGITTDLYTGYVSMAFPGLDTENNKPYAAFSISPNNTAANLRPYYTAQPYGVQEAMDVSNFAYYQRCSNNGTPIITSGETSTTRIYRRYEASNPWGPAVFLF